MKNTSKIISSFFSLWLLVQPGLYAREGKDRLTDGAATPVGRWYGGITAGVPFGVSAFSSFGADKTRAGVAFGLFGGYRFNSLLSTEWSMRWGRTGLSARGCCTASDYWLGVDGVTFHAPVAGFDGADYAALKTSVALQQYGTSLNVNLLGLSQCTAQSRWMLELSPQLAAVGTKADVKTLAADRSLIKDRTRWHLGAGGSLRASYAVTDNLRLGLYSGVTWLTGRGMDAVAKHIHDANFLWESGVRMGWTFGKSRRRVVSESTISLPAVPVPVREEPAMPAPPDSVSISVAETPAPEEKVVVAPAETLTFPIIYFDFDRSVIRTSETDKLQAICELLRDHPDLRVRLTGWCDRAGSRAVNLRISLRRAEAVRAWLTAQGIDASRLEVRGMGIDYAEPVSARARRVVTETVEKEVQP